MTMQPQHGDAPPKDEALRADERLAYAREAAQQADQRAELATASLDSVAARRVRYQEAVIRHEIRQAQRENERAAALEHEQASRAADRDAEFMREQIAPMLEEGWTLEQLAEIGISRAILARLGLLHDATHRRVQMPRDAVT